MCAQPACTLPDHTQPDHLQPDAMQPDATQPDATQPAFDPTDPVFALHLGGKLETNLRVPLRDTTDLSMAYSPGVARVCEAIAQDQSLVRSYTRVGRTIAVVSDGTAVLGLGNIGPEAAMPVMEGKAMLFKHFAGIDSVPICLDTTDVDQIVETVAALAPSFGGINLEDISAPRCFEVERRLQERLDIPVFHDDQHGTAIVTLAALTNAAKALGRDLAGLRVVVQGAGAAGVAIAEALLHAGVEDLIVCNRKGIIGFEQQPGLPDHLTDIARRANPRNVFGDLAAALVDAEVFIGVSGGQVPEEWVARMAPDAVIFGLANPNPEVPIEVAHRHAAIVATGRSDYPNQVNNVLAFPGIFKGALDCGAAQISAGMKLAAAQAIADCVPDPTPERIIPGPFEPGVVAAVSSAVAAAARAEGVARH